MLDLQKITINSFRGMYDRGGFDEVPSDHGIICDNLAFSRKNEVMVRPGTNLSVTSSHPVIRQFLSTVNGSLLWLTCDGAGHIYRQDTGALFLAVTGMIDFAAVNMFDKTFIAPLLSAFSATNYIYVYDGISAPRPMGGAPPDTTFTATDSATPGNVSPGVHQFAVSYITDTGYVTAPGPVITGTFAPVSLTAAGSLSVDLASVPLGPIGTVARQLFATKSGLSEFFYIDLIADNTTTAITIDFFDTSLAVSADSLFDQFTPLSGTGFSGMALVKYNGRLIVISGEIVYVSQSGDAETFSSITGALSIPSESDGNNVRSGAELFGVLYIMKAVGIFSTQDNGGEPNTWTINHIEGAVGTYQAGLGSISGSQSSLTLNSVLLMANRSGLFLFNGNVGRPALSNKIQDLWDTITISAENTIQIAVDPFNCLLYVLLPLAAATVPNVLLVGDYAMGLTPEDIRWSRYNFPWDPSSISMINVDDGSDFVYQLRLGTSTNIYKLHPNYDADYGSVPIAAVYTTYMATFGEGSVNIFSYLKMRVVGTGDLIIELQDTDFMGAVLPPVIALATHPRKEYGRQINFMNEKMCVSLGVSALNNKMTLSRLDIFGKVRYAVRPNG